MSHLPILFAAVAFSVSAYHHWLSHRGARVGKVSKRPAKAVAVVLAAGLYQTMPYGDQINKAMSERVNREEIEESKSREGLGETCHYRFRQVCTRPCPTVAK